MSIKKIRKFNLINVKIKQQFKLMLFLKIIYHKNLRQYDYMNNNNNRLMN